ncbi:MAG: hypothetical protein JW940_21595 [Polyangiaceae bacterium]|nr:hypothetical protein [Polyangiaceae bacterium]
MSAAREIRLTGSGKILFDDGSHELTLKTPTGLAADVSLELPDSDGTSGQVLKTDGAGKLAWSAAPMTDPGSGTSGQVLSTNGSGVYSWVTRAPYNRTAADGWMATVAASTTADIARFNSVYFHSFYPIRAGSITGLFARFSAAITSGSVTITVRKNDTNTAMTVTLSSTAQQAISTLAPGTVTFAAGDKIGVQYEATADFAPSNSEEVDAGIEMTEA